MVAGTTHEFRAYSISLVSCRPPSRLISRTAHGRSLTGDDAIAARDTVGSGGVGVRVCVTAEEQGRDCDDRLHVE
jgi:hypothetical protein